MTNLARFHAANLPELMDKITRNSIGMDEYLNRFWDDTTTSNYPPYNLVSVNNVESRLEIALAGFKKEEVNVFTEYGKLHVEGSKEDKDTEGTYTHKGLAQRSFKRAWILAEETEVKSVSLEDGLLTVVLAKIVPDHHSRKNFL